jgi:hypothetical protein
MERKSERTSLPLILSFFLVIQDPRVERNKLYPLEEVIVITLLTVMAMAQER